MDLPFLDAPALQLRLPVPFLPTAPSCHGPLAYLLVIFFSFSLALSPSQWGCVIKEAPLYINGKEMPWTQRHTQQADAALCRTCYA